jgi:HSP20 family molecular chaperone IbpA
LGRGSTDSKERGELVERSNFVSFVLMAPGYCLRDFRVRVKQDKLHIDAPDFELTRALRCRAGSAVKTEYRNGVLSVRIPKML